MTVMPSRHRLHLTLAIVLLVVLCALVPGLLFATELALRELRLLWWLILVLAGLGWLLVRFGRKR